MPKYTLPLARKAVSSLHPSASGAEYDVKSFLYIVLFYALYVGVAFGTLSAWVFLCTGPFIFIRTLNAWHEGFHVRRTRLAFLHWFAIVVGPLQFGYEQYRVGHHSHHAHPGTDRDIEDYLVRGSALGALFNALTQSEQGAFRFCRHRRLEKRVLLSLLVSSVIFTVVMLVGWGWPAVCYVMVTRLGNTFTWFMSHWVLHHPSSIDGLNPLPMPKALRVVWWIVFGPDGLAGARHHELHHAYPFVPDGKLPELMASLLTAKSSAATVDVSGLSAAAMEAI